MRITKKSRPVEVIERRGGHIENRHQVHACIMDKKARLVDSWGDVDQIICPRSSLKLIQTLPLIESGAAAKFNLSDKDIAVACGSHNGEGIHVKQVSDWLERVGLDINDFECGTHWPTLRAAEHALVAKGHPASALHNNCSGKHAAMLSLCKYKGWPLAGYTKPDHPLQQMILSTLSEMAEYPKQNIAIVIDGCSAPNFFLPLSNIALMFSKFISGNGLSEQRFSACKTVFSAVGQYSEMVAGSKRFCSALARSSQGRIIGKTGACGNYIALAPESGHIIYAKVEDGHTRSAELTICRLLEKLGLMSDEMAQALESYGHPIEKNLRDIIIGDIEAQRL